MQSAIGIQICESEFILDPRAALFWPKMQTLLIADVHLGKGAAFRNRGQAPVPPGSSARSLQRLHGVLSDYAPKRLLILGDLWHAREGCDEETVESFRVFLSAHPATEVILLEGNHDRFQPKLPIECFPQMELEGFLFQHMPPMVEQPYTFCGHIHPGVRLEGKGRQSLILPCLWAAEKYAVLPPFGEFTGVVRADIRPGDGIWVFFDEQVRELQPHQSPC